MKNPLLLGGLFEIATHYDAFILDVWGVLHNGIAPFSGTIPCLQSLKKAGKGILLLSNTPDRSPLVASHLSTMGITPDLYDHILTAGESAWLGLKHRPDDFHRKCGNKCLFAGSDFMTDDKGIPLFITGLDLDFVDSAAKADFILNACGGTKKQDYEAMWNMVKEALAYKLPMICTNPDLVVNIGTRQYLCAGTFAKFYEENGGEVLYHGKPHHPVYEMAWHILGKPDKTRMIAIGDSLHTDIQGANHFEIDSVFNFSGIHEEELETSEKREALLKTQTYYPTYLMKEFRI